jgi:hypothetical protein
MPQTAGNQGSVANYTNIYTITGAASGVLLAVANNNSAGLGHRAWIKRAWMEFSAAAAAACTIDVGVGDSESDVADGRSDDIFDGINVETGTLTLNVAIDTAALDIAGATAAVAPVAWEVDDFLLVHVKTGNGTGLVGKLYIDYCFAESA